MHRVIRMFAVSFAATLLIACSIDDGEPSGEIPTADAGVRTTKALGEPCKVASDCDSAQCFVGGQFAYCSLACGTDTAAKVCVPPLFNGVCNMKGFCKKP